MNYSDSMRFMTSHDLTLKSKRPFDRQQNEDPTSRSQSPQDSMMSESFLSPSISIGLTEKQAKMCYSLSKHSVIKETHNGIAEYDRLSFVEFLEMIGRIATVKYIGTDFEQEHL